MDSADCSTPPVVVLRSGGLLEDAVAWARRLDLPLMDEPGSEARFVLRCESDGLSIQPVGRRPPAPLRAEFVHGRAAWRRGQGELIRKAVRLRGRNRLHVLDATAGLGRDGFVLASHGFQVTMLERHPIVHALLEDGLRRARADERTAGIAARISLHRADFLETESLDPDLKPDVVYLDPMFPPRSKQAKVKKEMALLQEFVRESPDEERLLERALEMAAVKVVVKRPLKAPPLADRQPSGQLNGRSTRFDIYAR